MNYVGGLIIFRMLCAYIHSSGMLISAISVHLSLLHFSVGRCTLVLYSSKSGRVIPLCKCHCSASDLSLVIGIAAQFCTHRHPWFGCGFVMHLWYQWYKRLVLQCGFSKWSVVHKWPQSIIILHEQDWYWKRWWLLYKFTGWVCFDVGIEIFQLHLSIFPSSWSHLLFPRCYTSMHFLWFLPAGCPDISSNSLPPLTKPEPLFLTNSLWMPWMVWCNSLLYLCCICEHCPCISRVDNKSWYSAGMRPPSSVTISTLTMSVSIHISLLCILHCSILWRSGDR